MVTFSSAAINSITVTTNSSGGNVLNFNYSFTVSSVTAPETIYAYVGWKWAGGNGDINYAYRISIPLSTIVSGGGGLTYTYSTPLNYDYLFCGATMAFYMRFTSSSDEIMSNRHDIFCAQSFTIPETYLISERATQQDQEVWYNGVYQGETGCCVSNALSAAMEAFNIRDSKRVVRNSVGWLYGATANREGNTTYATALNFLRNTGIKPVSAVSAPPHMQRYPDVYFYDDRNGLSGGRTLYQSNIGATNTQKIKSWRQITQDTVFNWQQIFDTIQKPDSIVLVTVGVDDAFYDGWYNGGVVPEGYGRFYDGHMMLVLGWTVRNGTRYFVCQNSWGSWGGDDGLIYIPFINIKTIDDFYGNFTGIINFYEIVPDEIPVSPTPQKWEWDKPKVKGGKLVVTAAEWNNFCNRINEFREYKGLTPYTFTPVVSGVTKISADICNHALNGIYSIPGHGTIPGVAVKGAPITAYFFNQLRDALNAIS